VMELVSQSVEPRLVQGLALARSSSMADRDWVLLGSGSLSGWDLLGSLRSARSLGL
jgi:hypothetical protein